MLLACPIFPRNIPLELSEIQISGSPASIYGMRIPQVIPMRQNGNWSYPQPASAWEFRFYMTVSLPNCQESGSQCPSLSLSRGHRGPSPRPMALRSEQGWSYRMASTNRRWRPTVTLHCQRFFYLGRNKRCIDVLLNIRKARAEYKHKINNLKYVKSTWKHTIYL